MKTKQIHISQLRAGDTILHRGELKTVCKTDLTESDFMGRSVFGDSYKLGYEPVLLVTDLN